ncbi:hypothetical protein MNBD_NITROSPINAE01-1932 [hydrothermal vent metagenome]|uniref:Uncharacterized protein n=1 Tax=hydrothermal vent metagenome TaxID=652676 RepID=A0A3B1BX83_9ZZZZ
MTPKKIVGQSGGNLSAGNLDTSPIRKIYLLPLCFLLIACFGFILLAGMSGVADLLSMKTRYQMSEWKKNGLTGSMNKWDETLERMETASKLKPLDAGYLADLGKLYDWKAIGGMVPPAEARLYRERSVEYYKRSLMLGPTRSFTWVHLATSRMLNGQIDKKTFEALERAIVFGPWALGTQKKVIWLGIVAWPYLPETTKNQVSETIRKALAINNSAHFVIKLAVQYGWEENLRPLIVAKWQLDVLDNALERYKGGGN